MASAIENMDPMAVTSSNHYSELDSTSNWWKFELTLFEVTIHFKHEMIGIWQKFHRNFE